MIYRAEIDGLRALAVLPVIFFHAGFDWFKGGFVGVDVFFVISGYLITTIIISEISYGNFSLINFYERRARRILPALFFVMAACIPFSILWLSPSYLKDFGQSLIAVSTFSSNFLFWWESGYFDTAAELKPLLHTWSLAIEEQFYILFPLILILSVYFGMSRILFFLSIIFLLSLALTFWGMNKSLSASFYLLPTRGWELLAGSFTAFYLNNRELKIFNLLKEILSILGFCMIIYSIVMFDETTPFPSHYTLIPVLGTVLIIIFSDSNTFLSTLLSFRPLVAVGLVSYSAYLWHQPLFAFARHRLFDDVSHLLLIALSFISLILAWITWKYVEQPFRNKNFFNRQHIFIFTMSSILVFISIGAFIHFKSNEVSKWNPNFNYALWNNWNSLDQDRRIKIYAGECQFNGVDGETNISIFVENFACEPEKINEDTILIFGDSVAADAAQSIRYLSSNIIQLGGAGCQILPNEDCREIYIKLNELLSTGVKKVILANHITEEKELSENYINKIADYFINFDVSVILLPPPLTFENINCPFFSYCSDEISYDEKYYKFNKKFLNSDKFYIAPAYSSVCNEESQILGGNFCKFFYKYFDGENFYRTDNFHLNRNGARIYAEYLSDVINQRWDMDLKPRPDFINKSQIKSLDK